MRHIEQHMLSRLAREERGVAAVEFAIVLPLLLTLFLGGFVIADMISCYRKVTVTARALTDLASRNISPSQGTTSSAVTTYLSSAQLVMAPFAAAASTVQIALLRVCDASHAYVVWAQAQTGASTVTASLVAGSVVAIPANLATGPLVPTSPDGSDVCYNTTPATNKTVVGTAGGYLFLGQASYAYTPVASYGPVNTTQMADQIYMSPRLN